MGVLDSSLHHHHHYHQNTSGGDIDGGPEVQSTTTFHKHNHIFQNTNTNVVFRKMSSCFVKCFVFWEMLLPFGNVVKIFELLSWFVLQAHNGYPLVKCH